MSTLQAAAVEVIVLLSHPTRHVLLAPRSVSVSMSMFMSHVHVVDNNC